MKCQLGVIGLGVMGSSLALNFRDHGLCVAGYDKNVATAHRLANEENIYITDDLRHFIASLKIPRTILIMVPAGHAIDDIIKEIIPFLSPDDVLIDGGNSFYRDTERRQQLLDSQHIYLIGMGVSGGEKGAREGPCLMPGGNRKAYEQVRPFLEAIAARVANEPCVTYLGPGGVGHYVKMVHNGIEYGLMQLISEIYDICKRLFGFRSEQIQSLFKQWNETEIESLLLEITIQILDVKEGDHFLLDLILDVAEEKGTGSWTSEESFKLRQPVPSINAAVAMRDLSSYKQLRQAAHEHLKGPHHTFLRSKEEITTQMHHALYAGFILTYIQGFNLLQTASQAYHYDLKVADIAKIWRGGCIIRSAVLNQIMVAFERSLNSLIIDPYFSQELSRLQSDLRVIVTQAVTAGLPTAGLSASLSYYDAIRSVSLPTNLIQAQRDYFGSHTYKRIDQAGVFHTHWNG